MSSFRQHDEYTSIISFGECFCDGFFFIVETVAVVCSPMGLSIHNTDVNDGTSEYSIFGDAVKILFPISVLESIFCTQTIFPTA